jgi:G3E family GTPase
MVTVVDAVNLLRNYSSTVFLKDRGESPGEGDRRTLVDLLIEQIEFSDVIVLNKIDAASPGQRDAARMIIRALNPEADVIETSFSNAPLERILNTGRFDFERAQQHPLWFKELYGFADHRPETEEYGVSNFVYRARRPFDPTRFHQFLKESWVGVIRAKGHFWIATRPQWLGELSQAGAIVRTEGLGFWWANVPTDRWPNDPFWRQSLKANWSDVYGDRRQEIVFIGANMDQDAIKARLDACLVPGKTGMHLEEWAKLADPFPRWRRADEIG